MLISSYSDIIFNSKFAIHITPAIIVIAIIFQLTDLVFMGNPLEEELSEAEEYNNKVVRSVSQTS